MLITKYTANACIFLLIEISFFFINYDFKFRMNFDETKKNISKKIVREKMLKKSNKNNKHYETDLKTRENKFTTYLKILKTIRRCILKSSF